MSENYRLEREYTIPYEIFRDGYTAFQKKFVYPKSNIYTAVFAVLAVVFTVVPAFLILSEKLRYFSYLLIVFSIALAVRSWYNPRKLRNSLIEAVSEMGETVYKIGVGESFIDISTISETSVENSEALPEKTRIPVDGNFSLLEYESFFLIFSGKEMFYILPKENFDAGELDIVRSMGNVR